MDKPWQPALQGELASQAATTATAVARRCSSQVRLRQALAFRDEMGESPFLGWRPFSVAGGDAGIALLSAYMHRCFPEKGWDTTTHEYLLGAVGAYDFRRPNIGLFGGVAGLGLAAAASSQDGQHYAGLRRGLDRYMEEHVPAFILRASRQQHLRASSFDLVSGAAGTAVYLVSQPRVSLPVDLTEACEGMLRYLVTLTRPDTSTGLCCFIAPENIYQEDRRAQYPHGYSDTGLAHGVAGVVGALALAMQEGWDVPGIKEGLSSLASWLVAQQVKDNYGINWPSFIKPAGDNVGAETIGARAAWCYGIPGIARVLYMAGGVLHDSSFQQVASSAFGSMMLRPRSLWGIVSPNFCHGLSGILQASLRMYHDTGSPSLLPFIERLVREILSLYSSDNLLGFQDKNGKSDWHDNPRLLEGAPGVALALLAASQPINPDWDRLFLLS